MVKTIKILIVDDFATMRKIVDNFLVKLGFTDITQAEDAKKAWELLQQQEFDLVISDYNMPDMTGLELLNNIRTLYHKKDQKFIMLTAENDKEILVSTKNLAVNAYILKPFKIETLQKKLHTLGFL